LAELAAGAGHEINNPLAVIMGQAQHLLRTEEDRDRARALERIIAQSRRIHLLLKDLMLYARPPQPRPKAVNVRAVVHGCIAGLTEFALERGVRLEHLIPPRGCRVKADPALLTAAITCLLRNAIEAAPARGWVRAQIVTLKAHVEVVVEDNGPGVPAPQQEHLFDPFYSGRSAGRGAGLGLSKAWRIAQLHGGTLRFQSEPDGPTRFVLILPLSPAKVRPPSAPRHAARNNGRKNRKHPLRGKND
jgi:signal transduction histidine kinase